MLSATFGKIQSIVENALRGKNWGQMESGEHLTTTAADLPQIPYGAGKAKGQGVIALAPLCQRGCAK